MIRLIRLKKNTVEVFFDKYPIEIVFKDEAGAIEAFAEFEKVLQPV